MPNSINVNSKRVRVGLGSTLQDSDILFGVSISQSGPQTDDQHSKASGNYVGSAGIGT